MKPVLQFKMLLMLSFCDDIIAANFDNIRQNDMHDFFNPVPQNIIYIKMYE